MVVTVDIDFTLLAYRNCVLTQVDDLAVHLVKGFL